MKANDKVRVKSGENEGMIGRVIGPMPMSQVQDLSDGKDISMEGAIIYWFIEFEDGKQDAYEESELEIIF